jgi:hypothetical protein
VAAAVPVLLLLQLLLRLWRQLWPWLRLLLMRLMLMFWLQHIDRNWCCPTAAAAHVLRLNLKYHVQHIC